MQDLAQGTEDIDFDTMEQLLATGAHINATCKATGRCVMHEVAANWNSSVAEYLLGKGVDIHLRDWAGRTPLHVAASTNHTDMLEWLLERGAELEARTTTEKQTPLHLAARSDSVEAMRILIDKGGKYTHV